jgi:Kef-type K+ transport system membrane component KefB
MNIFFIITILIILARIISILFKKINLPPIIGILLIGVIIGPTGFDLIKSFDNNEIIRTFAQIGLYILIFLSGFEADFTRFRSFGRNSIFIAISGALIPLFFGYFITFYFTHDFMISIIMGFIVTSTSASISVVNLINIGQLVSVEGNTISNAAVIDDIIGIIFLSAIAGFTSGDNVDIFALLGYIGFNILYFIIIIISGFYLIPLIFNKRNKVRSDHIYLITSLIFLLLFAFSAGKIHILTISGLYFAGLFFSRTEFRNTFEETLSIGQIIFVSIFFIYIGLGLNFRIIDLKEIIYISSFVLLAFLGKIIGSGSAAKIIGFDLKRSFRIGLGMSPRGEISLVIASIAFFYQSRTFINEIEFISVVFMVLFTILISQNLLKALFFNKKS